MSSAPAPRDDPSLRHWMAGAMFDAAQQSHEAARRECRRRDELIAELMYDVARREYWWRSERFEARLEVFYRLGDPLQILGCRALEVDYVPPSDKRRLEIEEQFLQALYEHGAVREAVESHLVSA